MNNVKRIGIAKDFVACHKQNNVDDWSSSNSQSAKFDDDKYLDIYYQLDGGSYGEVREEGDDKVVEISGHDSASCNPVLFEWYADDK